jgi:hypothetical protein
VLVLSGQSGQADGPFIFDLDTTLPFPCPAVRYLLDTCSPQSKWPKKNEHRFRIIPATDYLVNFASDRSHMLIKKGKEYAKPPPGYPPILKGAGKMNLHKFWRMGADDADLGYGAAPHQIVDLRGLIAFIKSLPA